jgi:membrane-associated phospholipid phosphatase
MGKAKRTLLGAALGGVLLVLTYVLAVHVGPFERADASVFASFHALSQRHGVGRLASLVARLCNPHPYVFLAAIPVLAALVRRRSRVLVAVVVILAGANLTTEILKGVMPDYRPGVGEGTWPSGHATAAMSLALCCVLAAPARWRPTIAALGAAFTLGVCYSFLSLGWHYPSDVFGGFLVAGTWTMVAVAGIYAVDARWPRRTREAAEPVSVRQALVPQAVLVAAALVTAALVALARPHRVLDYVSAHELFVVVAAAIAVLAVVVATAITLVVRRR